jgi:hypothetical protein
VKVISDSIVDESLFDFWFIFSLVPKDHVIVPLSFQLGSRVGVCPSQQGIAKDSRIF